MTRDEERNGSKAIQNMSTKLYVGGLSYQTTDEGLGQLFAQAGVVTSAQVVTDRYTGQSRGFGFVEMGTQDEASKAITTIHGRNFEGRSLVVNEAKPREERGGGGGYNGGGNRDGGGYGGGGRY
ncbi:hypothetical protein IAD21_01480 [Abditibacteriota bacterium]|nr:hypothetical protein IAD21_01480 [Abditibacteriota bacterium]